MLSKRVYSLSLTYLYNKAFINRKYNLMGSINLLRIMKLKFWSCISYSVLQEDVGKIAFLMSILSNFT